MDPRPVVSAAALSATPPSSAPSTRTASTLAPHSEQLSTLKKDTSSSQSLPQDDQVSPSDDYEHNVEGPGQPSSLLLGVPDRAATASAPPDLEISSRSLFAFKAGYSGIFSDIRLDDCYESFYNENSERLNLPPPLPNRAAHDHHDSPRYLRRDDSDASINDLIFQETKGLRLSTSSADSALYTDSDDASQFRKPRRDRRQGDPSSVAMKTGKPPAPRHAGNRPPTQPPSQGKLSDATSSATFDAHSNQQLQKKQSQHAHESRFSISRHASPHPADPQAVSRHASPHPAKQQSISSHASAHPEVSSSHIVGTSLPYPVPSSSPPPLQARQEPRPRQRIVQNRGQDGPTVSSEHLLQHQRVSQPMLHRSASAPSSHEGQQLQHEDSADRSRDDQHSRLSDRFDHSAPQQRRYTSHTLRPQPLSVAPQPPLWQSLNQLSLDEADLVANSISVRRIYPSAAPPYGSSAMRSPHESSYVYPQPGSPLETHPSVAGSHLFDSPPQQHWARAPAPELNGLYDPRFDSVVQPPSMDQYPYKGRDDVMAMNAAMSPNVESAIHAAPPSVLPYPGSGLSGRGLYPQERQSYVSGRGSGNGSGRSNGRSRNHSSLAANHASSAFGYMYGTRAAASVVVPSAPDYLNAQAAAAAAAAAAAVYKTGGVHINGTTGGLSPFGGGGPPGLSNRSLGMVGGSMRGGSKSGDIRRSGLHEPYGRGKMSGMGSDSRDSFAQSGRGSGYRALDDDRGFGVSGGTSSSSGSGKFTSFNDVIGRAEELARDQHGCRFLQTKLEEGNTMYVNSIFEECYERFVELMTDPFGNYLCQKLFEHCNDSQRLALVERCAPAFPRVSTNMHGTRAVQRMVECLSTPSQVQAVCAALAPAAVDLMKDINGNHVIQRCLHRMDPAHNQFVYDAVANNCFELATHRHGCCVMQRCMDYASPAQRNQLATQINANALPLVQNAFGNYVVQYVLGLNDPTYTGEIIRRLRGHLAELSMQKFSSNVVEKGLQQGNREVRRELIFELISDPDTMRRLLHDAYGNYVIQRALQIAESPQLEQICEAIRPHLNSLRQSPYGKRIQAKIQKRMPKGMVPSIASN